MNDEAGGENLRRYLELIQRKPELAVSPPGGTIEVLTDPAAIAEAQREARRWRVEHGLSGDDVRVGILGADPYMTFVRDAVRFADGRLGLYNRILEGPCVAVLPILGDKLVLIRIFRHGMRDWSWEAPRGAVDLAESSEIAAMRELREEIGAEAETLTDLGPYTPGGASLAIRGRLYAAYIGRIGTLETAESICEARVVAVAEMERMIAMAEIEDGFTIALFARARARRLI